MGKTPRNFEDLIARIPGAKLTRDRKATAPCPVPGHKTPQGHLTVTDAGDKALVTCHGRGHSYEDIIAVWGFDSLTYRDNSSKPKPDRKIVATYHYTDESGNLLFQTLRYEPKDFKQRRPDGNGRWIWNLKGVPLVLYRLTEVLQAVKEGCTVYIVEGEKDAEALREKGLVATCNAMGAGKWRAQYTEVLGDASVVIIADKDEAGRGHAEDIARSLFGKGASLKVVELPDRDGHQVKDASDWLAAGGTRQELEQLVSGAPEWTPWQAPQAAEKDGNTLGFLEKAILALDGVCDGAISQDRQGFNKRDAEFFHPLAEDQGWENHRITDSTGGGETPDQVPETACRPRD